MEPLTQAQARQYSPLALAFLGDSVYEILVREYLVREANRPAAKLHEQKIQLVCAAFQAQAIDRLIPLGEQARLEELFAAIFPAE